MRSALLIAAALAMPVLAGGEDPPLPRAPAPRPKADAGQLAADGVIRLGSERFRVASGIYSSTMTPDGTGLVIGSAGRVVLLDLATGRAINETGTHTTHVPPVRPAVATDRLIVHAPKGIRVVGLRTGRSEAEWSAGPFGSDPSFTPGDLAACADGRCVAFGNRYRMPRGRVWVVTFGEKTEAREIEVLQAGAIWTALSPDGSTLASGGGHAPEAPGDEKSCEYVQLWDVATGRARHKLWTSAAITTAGAFSADGKRLLSVGAGGRIEVWDALAGTRVSGLRLRLDEATWQDWRFSPDGKTVAGITTDGAIRVWATDTGEPVSSYPAPAPPSSSTPLRGVGVGYDSTGKLVGLGAWGVVATIWDAAGGRFRSELRGVPVATNLLAFTTDAKTLLSAGEGPDVWAWGAGGSADPRRVELVVNGTPPLASLRAFGRMRAFSPGGEFLAIAQPPRTGGVIVFGVASRKEQFRVESAAGATAHPVWSPDGRRIALAGGDGVATGGVVRAVEVYDREPLRQQRLGLRVTGPIGCTFSPDGAILAVDHKVVWKRGTPGVFAKAIVAWDTKADRQIAETELADVTAWWGVTPGPRPNTFTIWVGRGGMTEAVVWDVGMNRLTNSTRIPLVRLTCPPAVAASGRRCAVGGVAANGSSAIFVLTNGSSEPLSYPVEHAGEVHSLALSRDGSRLAAGGDDGTILVRPLEP